MTNTSEYITHSNVLKTLSGNINNYNLPQLPEKTAGEVYDRIAEHEMKIATPDGTANGYRAGSATVADELYEIKAGRALLTAEHATDHYDAKGNPKEADWGTAGLGMVLHEDTSASLLVLRGKQTGNANNDSEHILKNHMTSIIVEEKPLLIAGLHGMTRGKFTNLSDKAAYDVLLGIGNNPNEASEELADKLKSYGKDLGLRVGINEPFVAFSGGKPVINEDGSLKMKNFKAAGVNTTRSHAQRAAEECGQSPALVQMELSSLLRFQPRGHELDPKSRAIGLYLGYLMGRYMVEQSRG